MPVIQFTDSDIVRNKLLEPGYYPATLTSISDFKTAKSGTSTNLTFVFVLDPIPQADGTFIEGKELRFTSNSAINFSNLIPLVAAVKNEPPQKAFALNTDELLNSKVDLKVAREIYEGRPINQIDGFLPYRSGQSLPF